MKTCRQKWVLPHQGFVVWLPGGIPLWPVLHTLNLGRSVGRSGWEVVGFGGLFLWDGVDQKHGEYMWGFRKWGYPKSWMVYFRENPKQIAGWFKGTPILGNPHIHITSFFSDFGCWMFLREMSSKLPDIRNPKSPVSACVRQETRSARTGYQVSGGERM